MIWTILWMRRTQNQRADLQQSLWRKICVRSYRAGLAQRAKGLASEVSPAEHLATEPGLNRALSSLRCRKGAERRQNVTDLCVWLFCTSSCKHCLFFPYIPAWNHTLVVCFVISFGAERRQENFLLDGLKGSVLYTTWVTRTMSDQSAVKWKKVTAQPEWDEFSHSAVARGRQGLALPGSSHRWLGQNNWDRDENTQPFLLSLLQLSCWDLCLPTRGTRERLQVKEWEREEPGTSSAQVFLAATTSNSVYVQCAVPITAVKYRKAKQSSQCLWYSTGGAEIQP